MIPSLLQIVGVSNKTESESLFLKTAKEQLEERHYFFPPGMWPFGRSTNHACSGTVTGIGTM